MHAERDTVPDDDLITEDVLERDDVQKLVEQMTPTMPQ